MTVHFNTFRYVESEKALPLFNSKGKAQSRIHLFIYNGDEHKDRYAIAAEKIEFGADELPSLGWLDRKFYVIMVHENTTYKVNRNSFEKRTGIQLDETLVDEETGVCSDLEEIVSKHGNELKKWKGALLNCSNHTFIQNFFQSLVSAKISTSLYETIQFRNADGLSLTPEELTQNRKPHLIIRISEEYEIPGLELNPNIRLMDISEDEYESIMQGHPLSEEFLKTIDYFAAYLELIKQHFAGPLETAFPNAKLILRNGERHAFDSVVGTPMQEIVNHALTSTTEITEAHLILQNGTNQFTVYSVVNHEATMHHYNSRDSLATDLYLSLADMNVFN